MHESGAFVEGVEGKLLNERHAINHDVVALGAKLDLLYLLASYYWAYVWLVDAYDTMGDTFLRITTLVVVTLLAVYLRYRLYF